MIGAEGSVYGVITTAINKSWSPLFFCARGFAFTDSCISPDILTRKLRHREVMADSDKVGVPEFRQR